MDWSGLLSARGDAWTHARRRALLARELGSHGRGRKRTMKVSLKRRSFLAGAAVAGTLPMPAIAQNKPIRIGMLTVKTGPLAQGGIQMEQGVLLFLKDKNYTMGGRKVDFISADTGGNPA